MATDVLYATSQGDGSEWMLDVYACPDPGPWPVVVFAHGFGGNRKGNVELSQAIAARGAVVFTFDWSALVDDVALKENGTGIREITEAFACAVRFAMATAPQY